jgi:hypothetical protein
MFGSYHGLRFFCSPSHPEELKGTPSLLSNRCWAIFLIGFSDEGMILPVHVQLVPKIISAGAIPSKEGLGS